MSTAILPILALAAVAAAAHAAPKHPFPLLVGGHAHGAANIRALADLGMGNFVWIPKAGYGMGNTPWDAEYDILADVDACVASRFSFMVSQRRGLGPEFKPGGPEYGGDTTPEIHPPSVIREMARRGGPLFVGLHAEELDADFLQNGLRAGSRSRTPQLYDFTDRAGGRRAFEGELRRIAGLAHAAGARFLPNLCVSLHQSGFRAGGDLVMAELLEALPSTELQLAYLRGAWAQFGKPWGVWVSPWHKGLVPVEDKRLWPGPNTAVGGGHDATRLRRCLYLSWVSGARVLTMQETEPLFSGGPGAYRPAAWGRELKAFWDVARRHPEPMEPLSALALLVDRDSGWAPGHLHGDWIERQTVWGKLQPERGDAMLAGMLDALLPGYERKTGWWKEGGSEYPGSFAPTPAGPFDIVASDASAATLARYPVVALAGDVAMMPRLLASLMAYVRGGGALWINGNQMRLREAFVQRPDFLGALIGQSHARSEWSRSNLLMRRTVSADRLALKQPIAGVAWKEWRGPWFVVQDVQPQGAEVVAVTGTGEPALLRHRYGKGEVWLSAPDFMLEGSGAPAAMLGCWGDLLRAQAVERAQVRVTAPGGGSAPVDVSWVAARQGSDVVVLLVNHGKAPVEAEVTVRGETTRRATVAAEDVAVVRLQRVREVSAPRTR